MNIVFETNLPTDLEQLSKGGNYSFDPVGFSQIPDKPGVYIVGVYIDTKDGSGIEKFCPLDIGETKNLQKRIGEHYYGTGGSSLNNHKELFDFLNHGINKVYDDISSWNRNHWWNWKKNEKVELIHKKRLYSSLSNNSMIFLSCKSFFDHYLSSTCVKSYVRSKNWQNTAIKHLNIDRGTYDATLLAGKIDSMKNTIKEKFYYAYWEHKHDIQSTTSQRQIVEGQTKYALETLKIHTYAALHGSGINVYNMLHSNTPSPLSKVPSNNIDLTVLSKTLYNPSADSLVISI